LDIPGRARGRYTHCYSQEAARAVRHLATGNVAACFGGVGRPLLLPGSNLSAVAAMAVTDRGRSALVDSPSAERRVLPTQTQRRRHSSENLAGRVHILPFYLFTSPTELSMGWVDPSIGLGCYSRLCGCHIFFANNQKNGWLGSRVVRRRRARVQIAAATLSGNSLRLTVHTHCASVHQAAKLVAALLRVARVIAGLAESNGSLPPGL